MSKPVNKDINFMNTQLLLKKYRDIQLSVNCRQIEIEDNVLYYGINTNDVNDTIKRKSDGEVKAQKIADINYSLINYMAICLDKLQKTDKQGAKAYDYLYISYLSMEPYTKEQMYAHFGISKNSFYKNLDRAVKRLSVIMWGIGGLDSDEFQKLCRVFYSFASVTLNKKELLSFIVNSIGDIYCFKKDKSNNKKKRLITEVVNCNTVENPDERKMIKNHLDETCKDSCVVSEETKHIQETPVIINERELKRLNSIIDKKIEDAEELLKNLKAMKAKIKEL